MGCNPRLILATSTNWDYVPRAHKYLRSIEQHSQIENHCLCLDFEPNPPDLYKNITAGWVNTGSLRLPLNNWCLQHGEFLDWIPMVEPDAVILFTDADLTMQRPFNDQELDTLRGLKLGDVYCGWNAGPKDTLKDEAGRLGLKTSMQHLAQHFGNLASPCFNWGCVAATRETWEAICDTYCKYFKGADFHLHHVAKQQWLLSWITSRCCNHIYMPPSFHAHFHYGMPEGCEYRDGLVYCDGELALFQHRFDR